MLMNVMKEQLNVILMLLAVTQLVHIMITVGSYYDCTCVLGCSGDVFNCTSMLTNIFMPSTTNDL